MRKTQFWIFIAFALTLSVSIGCQSTSDTAENAEGVEVSQLTPADKPGNPPKAGQPVTEGKRPFEPAPTPAAAPAPARRQVTLPAGTTLRVRTTNTLSTKVNQAGESFTASLEEPLSDGNWVVAPKGASVFGKVVNADQGGRVKGLATLAVRLTEIQTADGQRVAVSTDSYGVQAKTTKKEDLTKVGIGAGIGAAIGAIAGGGSGAAKGAGVGAGAGTGVVLATHGDPAVIPSESVLTFSLTEPVTIFE